MVLADRDGFDFRERQIVGFESNVSRTVQPLFDDRVAAALPGQNRRVQLIQVIVKLDRVIVADSPLRLAAQNRRQIKSLLTAMRVIGTRRLDRKPVVVIGHQLALQQFIGRLHRRDFRPAKFADPSLLQRAPQSLNSPLRLRTVCQDHLHIQLG